MLKNLIMILVEDTHTQTHSHVACGYGGLMLVTHIHNAYQTVNRNIVQSQCVSKLIEYWCDSRAYLVACDAVWRRMTILLHASTKQQKRKNVPKQSANRVRVHTMTTWKEGKKWSKWYKRIAATHRPIHSVNLTTSRTIPTTIPTNGNIMISNI